MSLCRHLFRSSFLIADIWDWVRMEVPMRVLTKTFSIVSGESLSITYLVVCHTFQGFRKTRNAATETESKATEFRLNSTNAAITVLCISQ